MNGLPYYKAYPRDFIEGTIGMPFEVKCAYRVVLDLIYMQGGELPDDARYISGLLGCSIRKWKSLRMTLIEAGKIEAAGEFLTNKRACKEIETLSKLQDKQRENRSCPNKNNNLQKPRFDHTEPEPEPELSIKDTNVSLSISPANGLSESVSIYNDAAAKSGWPQVQKITPTRSKQIRARLAECDGVKGWRIAVEKAQASEFLCGMTPKPWTGFGFDWLIKSQNFTKLMEGNYDNRHHDPRPSQRPENRPDAALEQIARLAGIDATQGYDRG